jgi:hypothetical protein
MLLLTYLIHALTCIQLSSTEIVGGYTDKISAFAGDTIELYLNAKIQATNHPIKLHDLSGKQVATVTLNIFPQSPPKQNASVDGFGYRITKRIKVPDVASGIYLWDNQIPMVIKSRNAKITVVYPSNTVAAYCNSGGKSLYGFNSLDNKAVQKVSFLRPMSLQRHSEAFFRWLHQQSLENVGYITDSDLDDYNAIRKSRLIIIAGHSEYWTYQARKNFDQFVNEGKDAMILSGNTMWWQVRYSKTKDQLVCYRDVKSDPFKVKKLKTTTWSDPCLSYPIYTSIGTDFQNAGYGLKSDRGWDGFKIACNSPLLYETSLKRNDVLSLPSDELDGVPLLATDNGSLIIDRQKLAFEKIEIVGYDLVQRGEKAGVATWIVFKQSPSSGIVINTATTDWCSARGIGTSKDIQKITSTMISKLINGENVFSSAVLDTPVN